MNLFYSLGGTRADDKFVLFDINIAVRQMNIVSGCPAARRVVFPPT